MGAQTQAGVSGVADLEKRRKGKGLRQGGGRELLLERRRKGRGIGKEGGGYWEHTTKLTSLFFQRVIL